MDAKPIKKKIRDNNPRPELVGHWFHYLRISSSYQLAAKHRQVGLTDEEHKTLPHDFDLVLKTYDDFGDVWAIDYWVWTKDKWRALFDANVVMPQLKTLAYVLDGAEALPDLIHKKLDDYLNETRPATGLPPTFIMAIPANMSRKRILDEVGHALDMHEKTNALNLAPKFLPKAKYVCLISKVRTSVLKLSYKIITIKAQRPKWKLWEVAAQLKLSPVHMEKIKRAEQRRKELRGIGKSLEKGSNAADEKALINAIMGRYMRNAFLLAENAARGKFPCLDSLKDENGVQVKTHFDFKSILDGVNMEIARQKALTG
jgi:hypothetical protein